MKHFIKMLLVRVFRNIVLWERQLRLEQYQHEHSLPPSVDLHHSVDLCGNVSIGDHTYVNEGTRIAAGERSAVRIGRYCEIGRYVHIMSYTHDMRQPTRDDHADHLVKESDISISDCVWIGDKVFVREGVSIGRCAIIGANSVVTRDIEPYEIVAGVPIQHIRFNKDHVRYSDHDKLASNLQQFK